MVFTLLGVILVGLSLYFNWYFITESAGGSSATSTSALFNRCSGGGSCYGSSGSAFWNLWTYSGYLVVVSLVLGIIALLLGILMMRGRVKASGAGGLPVLLAFFVGIAAPIWMAVSSPSAYTSASGGSSSCSALYGSTSPCTTFWGSGSNTVLGVNFSFSWGPQLGWYLAIIGAVLFFIAFLWGWRLARKMRAAPAA